MVKVSIDGAKNHQEFQVPKMEELCLMFDCFTRWGFPDIGLTAYIGEDSSIFCNDFDKLGSGYHGESIGVLPPPQCQLSPLEIKPLIRPKLMDYSPSSPKESLNKAGDIFP